MHVISDVDGCQTIQLSYWMGSQHVSINKASIVAIRFTLCLDGPEEMAQQLRAFVALSEDPDSIPSTPVGLPGPQLLHFKGI